MHHREIRADRGEMADAAATHKPTVHISRGASDEHAIHLAVTLHSAIRHLDLERPVRV
jgi:hypothetical protein